MSSRNNPSFIARKTSNPQNGSTGDLLSTTLQHHRAGRIREAADGYQAILTMQPNNAEALHGIGLVAHQSGRNDLALSLISKAIEQKPNVAAFHANLGLIFHFLGRFDEAITECRLSIHQKPDQIDAHFNIGNTLHAQGKFKQAADSFRESIKNKPNYGKAYSNLGNALLAAFQIEEAVEAYKKAIEIHPDLITPHNNLLFTMHYTSISQESQLLCARKFGDIINNPQIVRPETHNSDPERRLKIGYVSGDFRSHPVGFFISKILENHNRNKFEIFCYSNHPGVDSLTEALRSSSDHWRSITQIPDGDVASMIKKDEIDILVDLSGHTEHNRLTMFALRPSPLQISYLGYWGTTGLGAMDYVVLDSVTAPEGDDRWYTESLIRLPHGRFCYNPPSYAPDPTDPPAIKNKYITFGTFNNIYKISGDVIALWAEVILASPGSRLLLKSGALSDPIHRQDLIDKFAKQGVDESAIEFRGSSPHADMLAQYADIDIALDPFPFGGGLTSCEALWMGVPIITLPGPKSASRQTLGFLSEIGLQSLAADSPAEYVAKASILAADIPRLEILRHSLRSKMKASPLCDGPAFTQDIEAAYRMMWSRLISRQPLEAFAVPSAVLAA